MREVRLKDGIASFDGTVLEVFGQGDQSRRIHVGTIEALEGSGGTVQIKVRGESDTFFSFEADDATALEELLGDVRAKAGLA